MTNRIQEETLIKDINLASKTLSIFYIEKKPYNSKKLYNNKNYFFKTFFLKKLFNSKIEDISFQNFKKYN